MKYLITESQIENLMFQYLDSLDLVQTEKDDKIYFKKSEGDSVSIIVYDKNRELCKLSWRVINEISEFFSIDKSDSKEVIGRWVEKTIQMKVSRIEPLVAAQKRHGIWS